LAAKVYKIFSMRYLKKGYIYDKIKEIYGSNFMYGYKKAESWINYAGKDSDYQ